ncbi:hypothetical protein ACH44C_18470 [Streptomyces purpureus]|uniref:hypothetical protein n=1 Tax=Streptomyces purpureus TaxID=1951 RepID=UPI0003A42DAF|nr:hypothetical protein [Streptomyces purpureus]
MDKKQVLTVKGDVIDVETDPMKVHAGLLVNSDRIGVGDDGRVGDATVIAVASCTYRGEARRFVAQVFPPTATEDVAKRRGEMARFMTAYFPAAKKAAGCTN